MKRLIVERDRYFDSVFLMRISSRLETLEGVTQAVVAMGTPINVDNLIRSGFSVDTDSSPIRPADLIVAVDAVSEEAMTRARTHVELFLKGGDNDQALAAARPSTLEGAMILDPKINLALISVPGAYAAREAMQALRRDLHVMLFSDNVAVEDEIRLKNEAAARGLLMMGPDCGTAIINGAALGFANACRRGSIGMVGASGTGIQEVSSLIHRLGGGISQAIGTGGRDLSEEVGGRMTCFGIDALGKDPQTDVVVVVSKTPGAAVAERVIETLARTGKPSVVHFIGGRAQQLSARVESTATLADAAVTAVAKAGVPVEDAARQALQATAQVTTDLGQSVQIPAGTHLVGLFCGGTLCQEAWNILHQAGIDVDSNVAGEASKKVSAKTSVAGHVLWDLGDDAFTVGKPHPMIEPRLRDDRVAEAGADPAVGVILADCVIGYGAHANPAGSLAEAAARALKAAARDKRDLVILASVTGTDEDPQHLSRQLEILKKAGVAVAPSNAAAARNAAGLLKGRTS